MSKYEPLQRHLSGQDPQVDQLNMTFSEVEQLVGLLPRSAYVHQACYIAHARKVGTAARRGTGRSGRKPSAIDTVAVRAWARDNGLDIKERGRVPADVVAKYREATGN